MRRVAVLGANGQIGTPLLRRLALETDLDVVAISRNSVGAATLSDIACDIRIGSVAEAEGDRLIGDCDVVFNCIWPNLPSKQMAPENEAIIRSVAAAKNPQRLVQLSSIAVYGCVHPGSTFERPKPDTTYGKEKLSLEKYVQRILSNSSKEYVIIRLGHVFGPHQWLSRDILDLSRSGSFELPFDGDCPSNAIHIDELSEVFTQLIYADVESGIYNLAASPQRTWRYLFDWHCQACAIDSPVGMSIQESRRLRENYIMTSQKSVITSCLKQISGWLRSLPLQQLIGTGDLRSVGSAVLRYAPERLRIRVKSANAIREVGREIASLRKSLTTPAPWFFSDSMPGRYLDIPRQTDSMESLNRRVVELQNWHLARSRPQWSLLESSIAQWQVPDCSPGF